MTNAKTISLRDWQDSDAAWIEAEHRAHYAASDGFDDSFGDLVAEVLADFAAQRGARPSMACIAETEGTPLGSVLCHETEPGVAQIRLFLLLPQARGLGLGRTMLTRAMDWAKDQGFERMTLWTHESHAEACALYAKLGWVCMGSEPMEAFGVHVIRQNWEFPL